MAVLLRRVGRVALQLSLRQTRTPQMAPLLATLLGTCRTKKTWPKSFSQEELKKRLSPIQFHVTQERGTESAFRGEYTEYKEDGIYTCVVCGAPLFK
uniref:L-methionine (R)-S-oxide reductase n=1 Tax=Hucho hucho TaxID=62062 RepID=A0A4W5KK87_9TELE